MGIIPDRIKDEIFAHTKGIPQISADSLQKKYINGLSFFFDKMMIINAPFVDLYPFNYTCSRVSACEYEFYNNNCHIHVKSLSFRTNPLYYSKDRESIVYHELKSWVNDQKEDDNIIVLYSVHQPFMKACERLKTLYENTKVIQIIPDFPEFMNSSSSLLSKLHLNLSLLMNRRSMSNLYKVMDGFVFITKHMAEFKKEFNRPYVVIEGIANEYDNNILTSTKKQRYILYSGTMAEKYGIKILVDAFLKMNHKDCNLLLCGSGDSVDYIRSLGEKNRIHYLGVLDNNRVLELQRNATLLVNPRINAGEYVKYSFPSKIFEYFSSGTPTLMYKLDGIPDEYFNYCFEAHSMNPERLAIEIEDILSKKQVDLDHIGKEAFDFVEKQKGAKEQCKKIISLIKTITN